MPKIVDHQAYRSELLQASFDVAAQVGFGSLSMKQLARHLRISTGSIYHYFENKEDWFVSLVTHFSRETLEALHRDIDPEASLSQKVNYLIAHIDQRKEIYANMVSVASDFIRMPKAVGDEGMLEIGFVIDQLYDFIEKMFETDEATARALASYLLGVIMANRMDPRGVDATDHLPFICTLLNTSSSETQDYKS